MELTDSNVTLNNLFKESAGDLSRYFTRRHGAGSDAEDLVQETFLQMAHGFQKGHQFRCARGYLFGIARRLSQERWKSREQNTLHPFKNDYLEPIAPVEDTRVATAREVILHLETEQQEILELRFTQNLSYAEIAEALSIPLGTVRSRLHYAIAEVRRRLNSDSNF